MLSSEGVVETLMLLSVISTPLEVAWWNTTDFVCLAHFSSRVLSALRGISVLGTLMVSFAIECAVILIVMVC